MTEAMLRGIDVIERRCGLFSEIETCESKKTTTTNSHHQLCSNPDGDITAATGSATAVRRRLRGAGLFTRQAGSATSFLKSPHSEEELWCAMAQCRSHEAKWTWILFTDES